ncbi:pyridoxal-phosphate dependent enzyme [Halorubrum sp. Atlit-8R]|uniref:pyridoxal-phosphate dependent enzyme n=1 Tax=unclassified Halorubrum TaxID=2642239 RepID=UPI000EF1BD3B|nr:MULTISPECIES: pyridoxal-phosphate dependent enzyme [unclassified Halorubrum]RLM71054.1 pyridoxal-phosphate dependent enzyme [Halorubrum sp. Atlit-9R]RLM71922.1 pyridoxal-phosphate dependent enzyme [Halorubrum sp. Atlit-9R]RLM82793.1 pyridoxal-phosphate dependent enzyme [Halorubrum sp. Atlit-8R]
MADFETTPAFRGLESRASGRVHETADAAAIDGDERARGLDPVYDYDAVDPDDLFDPAARGGSGDARTAPATARGHWRFDALLPFPAADALTAGEGATPLVATDRLADELDVEAVYVKDEGRNPTGTVLDRGLSLAMTAVARRAADGADVEPLVCASPGNAGQSMAAYAGRADLRSYAFVPSRCAFSNKSMTNVHGGEMRVVGGRFPDAAEAVDEQLETEYTDLGEFVTPYRHEGAKTVAFELVADLGDAPDVVVVPTGSGEVVAGVYKGFAELDRIGAVDGTPKVVAAQAAGCAPIAAAVERGLGEPEPWGTPDTICGELEIPDPAGGAAAVEAVAESGGTAVGVEDDDILASAVAVAQNEVVEMGATGGAAPAGAWALAEEGFFDGDETVVLLNSDAGLKTPDVLRSHLMGQGI